MSSIPPAVVCKAISTNSDNFAERLSSLEWSTSQEFEWLTNCFTIPGSPSITRTHNQLSASNNHLEARVDSEVIWEGKFQCWEHGCGGRTFTNLSNYRRHCRERSLSHSKSQCTRCLRCFSRPAAKQRHQIEGRCKGSAHGHDCPPFAQQQPSNHKTTIAEPRIPGRERFFSQQGSAIPHISVLEAGASQQAAQSPFEALLSSKSPANTNATLPASESFDPLLGDLVSACLPQHGVIQLDEDEIIWSL